MSIPQVPYIHFKFKFLERRNYVSHRMFIHVRRRKSAWKDPWGCHLYSKCFWSRNKTQIKTLCKDLRNFCVNKCINDAWMCSTQSLLDADPIHFCRNCKQTKNSWTRFCKAHSKFWRILALSGQGMVIRSLCRYGVKPFEEEPSKIKRILSNKVLKIALGW